MKRNRGKFLNNVTTLLKVMSRKFDDLEQQIKTINFNFGGNKLIPLGLTCFTKNLNYITRSTVLLLTLNIIINLK